MLPLGDEPRRRASVDAPERRGRPGHPQHRVQVPQPADALLHVRLLDAHRAADAGVAVGHLGAQRLEEGVDRLGSAAARVERRSSAVTMRAWPVTRRASPRAVPRGQVAPCLVQALRQRAEAVADRESGVPEQLEHPLDEGLHGRLAAPLVQEEQVDVRAGCEFAAP